MNIVYFFIPQTFYIFISVGIDLQTFYSLTMPMKKVNKQCLLDTPRKVRVSEKT